MTNKVVIYHYPCFDGIYAALCAHLHFSQSGEEGVRYIPLTVYKDHKPQDLNLKGDETGEQAHIPRPPPPR